MSLVSYCLLQYAAAQPTCLPWLLNSVFVPQSHELGIAPFMALELLLVQECREHSLAQATQKKKHALWTIICTAETNRILGSIAVWCLLTSCCSQKTHTIFITGGVLKGDYCEEQG